MSVSAADVAELQAYAAANPLPRDDDEFAPLKTAPAVAAYLSAFAKSAGLDPADFTELAFRASGASPDEVRHVARVLGAMGFVEVATRLREIAGRRKHELKPIA